MTAVLLDEAVAVPTTRSLRVPGASGRPSTSPQCAPKKAARRANGLPLGIGPDPLVDGVALLLTVPVRHMYAALLRAGVLEVRA